MPTELIELNPTADKVSDQLSLPSYAKRNIDGFFSVGVGPNGQQTHMWNKRWGLSTFTTVPSSAAIKGLYYWNYGTGANHIIAQSNTGVYSITGGGTVTDVTGLATLSAASPPSFAHINAGAVYVCAGSRIGKYTTSASSGVYLDTIDADAPGAVAYLAPLNQALYALSSVSPYSVYYSGTGTPDSWSGEFVTAETLPDKTLGLTKFDNRLVLAGMHSLEIWYDDGVSLSREPHIIPVGVGFAPSVLINIKDTLYWLSGSYEPMRLAGGAPTKIAPLLPEWIVSLSGGVSSASIRSKYIRMGGRDFWVLFSPTFSVAYDIDLNYWVELGYWGGSSYTPWLGNSSVMYSYDPLTYIGSRAATGKIYKLDGAAYTDDGATIRCLLQTEQQHRGDPSRYKFCKSLTFYLKRAQDSGSAKYLKVRYRDEGSQTWSEYRTVPITAASSTDLIAKERLFGRYKIRQWEFLIEDSAVSSIVAVQEEFDYGR